MPFKANVARRHRIPKQRRRLTNWAEYDPALHQHGSLTVWFTEAAIAAWHAELRTTPGGQSHYSSLAIATALTLKAVFRLALQLIAEHGRMGWQKAGYNRRALASATITRLKRV